MGKHTNASGDARVFACLIPLRESRGICGTLAPLMDTVELTNAPADWYKRLGPELRLALLLLIAGLCLAGWGIWGNLVAAETSGWNATTGICERVEVKPLPLAKGKYDITAKYTYELPGGRIGAGRNMTRLGPLRVDSAEERDAYVNQYQFGKMVSVRVNPKDPRMAVLHTGSTSVAPFTGPVILWGGILGILGLLILTTELNRRGLIT